MIAKIWRCIFVWRVKYPSRTEFYRQVSEALAQGRPVVICTHDISLSKGNVPGRGNILLAEALKRVTQQYPKIPVLAQLGVALAAEQLKIPVTQTIGPPKMDTRLDRSGEDYNSQTVVADQKRWCEENGMFPALAVTLTVPLHMPRVQWVMEKEGFTVLPMPLVSMRQRDYLDVNSLYRSVRLAGKYWWGMPFLYAREMLGRLWFLKNGWM
ncbi:MAG: hypothetical protein Q7R88_02220 [bacterium]|nr:hypothetical protein [bacterium]